MALNPTGSTVTSDPPAGHGVLPTTGGGNYNFGNTQNPNPPPSSSTWNPYNFYPTVGNVSANPPGTPGSGTTAAPGTITTGTSQPVTSTNTLGIPSGSANQTLEELRNQYGDGMGTLIYQYLMSGGGYNAALAQQNVDATNAAMQKNIQLGEGNLQTNLAESGISPDSSSSALEISNYLSDAYTKMNEIDASIYYDMWNQSQNRELSLLQDTGKVTSTALANQPGFFGTLSNLLPLVSSGAGAASSIVSDINPGADTGVLDALAGLAA